MYLIKTPELIQNLFPNFTWKIPNEEKKIFLTFDDGPIPEITPWVVKTLEQYHAKATFFCVGENVQKYASIAEDVRSAGHSLGSHTYNHLSGWSTDNIPFFHNVRQAATLVKSPLFRPPYGRIKPSQIPFMMRHYHIIMWEVLSGDFDPTLTKEQCLENVINNAKSGSIIVMHDSIKAGSKLKYVLPAVLEHYRGQGYTFERITEETLQQKEPLKICA